MLSASLCLRILGKFGLLLCQQILKALVKHIEGSQGLLVVFGRLPEEEAHECLIVPL